MTKETEWSEKEIQLLSEHWPTSMTCLEIGRLCGKRTKNAVISQAVRLNLGPKPRWRGRGYIPLRGRPSPIVAILTTGVVVTPLAPIVALQDLEKGMCSYPVSDPATGKEGFCGCAAANRYCKAHMFVVYQPKRLKATR